MTKALITGITGQDGYYLSKLLLEKGYEVHGIVRRSSNINTKRIDNLISSYEKLSLHYGDLLDFTSLSNLIYNIQPDEVYNLAAQSHVGVSFKNPMITSIIGTNGVVAILEAIKSVDKKIKFYQAGSSEMFGGLDNEMINIKTPFNPKSPYAASKVFGFDLTKIYRESYNMFCVNGILFNHESPLRGETFVTRKISKAVGRISLNLQEKLTLGNLDAVRDWGYAGDYVEAMWLMLNHDKPGDWIVSTGESYSVKNFLEEAFSIIDKDWQDFVTVSEKYYRPNEVHYLLGDSSETRNTLGWKPTVSFKELVKMMVESDIKEAESEKILLDKNLLSPTWEHPINN